MQLVEIELTTTLPLFGLLGVNRGLTVAGHAVEEGLAVSTWSSERGGAIVEFHFLGLLLVPLVYIPLTVLDVQASYGVALMR